MGTSSQPVEQPVESGDVPKSPGTDREPEPEWNFTSAVADEDMSEHGRAHRSLNRQGTP